MLLLKYLQPMNSPFSLTSIYREITKPFFDKLILHSLNKRHGICLILNTWKKFHYLWI